MKTIMISAALLSLIACNEAEKDEAMNSEASDMKTITVSGTLTLDSTIPEESSDGLSPGAAIADATVFLKGYPTEEVRSDATGAFTLAIEVEESAALTEDAFKVLMWKETDTAGRLFGAMEEFTVDSNDEFDVGPVTLTYTNAIHFHVLDEISGDYIAGECNVSVDGFSDRIPTVKTAAGKYDSSYMPPDDYDFAFECEGYETKQLTVSVPPATKNGTWTTEKFNVTPIAAE